MDEDDEAPTPNAELLLACGGGDAARADHLLNCADENKRAHPDATRAEDGATALMLAAGIGRGDLVALLLRAGASWNLLDSGGRAAAQYSGEREPRVTSQLGAWAVECEEALIAQEEEEVREDEAEERAAAERARERARRLDEERERGGRGDRGDAPRAGTPPPPPQAPTIPWPPCEARRRRLEEEDEGRAYLAQRLVFSGAHPTGARLLDAAGDAVMMGWEAPIMRVSADWLCGAGAWEQRAAGPPRTEHEGEVTPRPPPPPAPPPPPPPLALPPVPRPLFALNVGFGLGIVDRELQRHAPARHVIVEAHPDVLARIDAEGWPSRPGVTVLRGRWEDVLRPPEADAIADVLQGGGFGAVYWDTYAQHARHMTTFFAMLPRLLKRPTPEDPTSGRFG